MSKYDPLTAHLSGSGRASLAMTFDDVERIVGTKLPASAFKHRPWWSNNPSNSSITQAWLAAGYKTEKVDMPGRKLVFRRASPDEPSPETEAGRRYRDGTGASGTAGAGFLSRVFGALEGTVTVAPGTDLTSPVGEEWFEEAEGDEVDVVLADLPEANKSAGVVKAKYHQLYRERGNPRHCGDWLAKTLDGVFDNGGSFDADAYAEFLRANGVEMVGKWAALPASDQPGWKGRFRMNGRQKLQRRVLKTGVLLRIIDGKTVEEEAPIDWLLHMETMFPAINVEAWTERRDAYIAEQAIAERGETPTDSPRCPSFLLDTCAVIWIASGDLLREPAASELRRAHGEGGWLLVSPMTAWEIAMLVATGRMALAMSPDVWFGRFCGLPGVTLAEMPPGVLVASANLPGTPPADPVDHILAATAREFGYTLATRDGALLEYGGRGHLRVMAC